MRPLSIVLIALFLVTCAKPEPAPPPPAPRLIFLGLDGADWQLLDRYMTDGTMPNLARLVAGGDKRVLKTQHPPLSPLVWTSMMTGVSPLEHRILDFTRFNPSTHEREPITSDERAVPAVWNMATIDGKHVDVFGLWATYPAEPINGTLVSDRLFSFQFDEASPPPGAVSPAADEPWARQVASRVAKETGFDALHDYVPSLTRAEYAKLAANPNAFANPVTALRRVLIETEVMHRLAKDRIARDKPELAIVYIQGTDAIGHLFAPFAPPKLDAVSQADYDRYHDVPRRYFAHVDALIGDYAALAQSSGAKLVIASDHGFVWGEGRSPVSSTAVATAAKWHREDGIFVHWPGRYARDVTRADEICSVLLDLLGMPRDVSSYRRRFVARKSAVPAAAANDELAKLKSLGYVGSSEPSRGTGTRTAGSYNNEGLLLREHGDDTAAIAAFENALRVDANSASAMWNLSELLRESHRDDARATQLLERAIELDPNEPRWLMVRGRYALERQDCDAALKDFHRAEALAPNEAIVFASIGAAELCLGNDAAARTAFDRSLQLDPNQPLPR
jgi:predicted AlkP superfamily pyrophosphatase or phosphodiesterase/Flp pilus assembly protein TadD